jgi:hypothetical protein
VQPKSRKLEIFNNIEQYQSYLEKLIEVKDKQRELKIGLSYYRAQFPIRNWSCAIALLKPNYFR